MHAQVRDHVLAAVIEHVCALRARTAVRANVRTDAAHHAVLVDDERALCGDSLIFTRLHRLKFANTLELGVFRGHYTRSQADETWRDLVADIRAGRLQRTAVNWPSVFRTATNLSRQFSATIGSRSLDLLHVAAARVLGNSEFLSFDQRQSELARAISSPEKASATNCFAIAIASFASISHLNATTDLSPLAHRRGARMHTVSIHSRKQVPHRARVSA